MKRFYVIPPIKHMDLANYSECDAVYCLAHLCLKEANPEGYEEYKRFFIDAKKKGMHVILDNSAAEEALVTEMVLFDLTVELDPSEVIAPDVLFNENETRLRTTGFIELLKDQNIVTNIFGVPQGNNPESYLKSYIQMLESDDIEVIGLSKLSVPKSFREITGTESVSVNRRYLIRLLNELNLLRKPIHCLGMRNHNEYEAYQNIPMIRSTDSCWTCLAAMKRIQFTPDSFDDYVCNTPHDYFFKEMTLDEQSLAKRNIDAMIRVIGATNKKPE